jgi:hypothetical protein
VASTRGLSRSLRLAPLLWARGDCPFLATRETTRLNASRLIEAAGSGRDPGRVPRHHLKADNRSISLPTADGAQAVDLGDPRTTCRRPAANPGDESPSMRRSNLVRRNAVVLCKCLFELCDR